MLSCKKDRTYSIQTVESALTILEALCETGEEVRLSSLSVKLGMKKTSVFRYLATFERRGYVERVEKTGTYRLGLSAFEMGQKLLSRMDLLRKAKPAMERLARECNEAVYLGVPRGQSFLFLDMVDTTHQIAIAPLTGKYFSLYQAAAGKVLLAFSNSKQADFNKTALSVLCEELDVVRQQGFCVDSGALGDGISSLATPLLNAQGYASGCLCLVGPEFRLTEERMESLFLPRLKEAGQTISAKLGHHVSFMPTVVDLTHM
ncbi:IclR family transcriptional regulator [Geothermobacter ehrlichii]|uniref:IclR family transcriptional regulator n=1 Tax=Geothermobacter ehrlichii TaxID=213224 RepID=A0A5D3WFV6_9BACT|nr:IclR family transcriptional regulator [Geothermobacter ehrlichii]TYO95241.1 IclR family transcriptional regulator [Geothermobacter ehrlichii]